MALTRENAPANFPSLTGANAFKIPLKNFRADARKRLFWCAGGEAPVARLAKRTRGVDRYLPGCVSVTRPPFFSKLFANFDTFLRQRGTRRRHSELVICVRDSIFVSLSWYCSISLQRHQNFAPAASFLIRMTYSLKMNTSHTIRKFCEKSGPFFRGICPGPVDLNGFSCFFNSWFHWF